MVFMVIEHFKKGPAPVRERFLREGRLLPDGVVYHSSWIDPAASRCFQVMEAGDLNAIRQWTSRWDDLVGFEIVPVLTSQQYWAAFNQNG
jgi:hypothetical protein